MKKSKKVKKPIKSMAKKHSSAGAEKKNTSGVIPLGDRILVKPASKEDAGKTTSFGIIIPDTVDKEKPEQGVVVAVGPGRKNDEGKVVSVSVNVGDTVMFSKYGYDEIKVAGVEYYILPEASILAVLS